MKYNYDLRIHHPHATLASITTALDLEPSAAWEVGAPRQTPKGTLLGGIREETYCSFALDTKSDHDLADWLSINADRLHSMMLELMHLADSGGTFDLIVFVFPEDDGHFGLELEPEHLHLLSSLRLRLGIDFYL